MAAGELVLLGALAALAYYCMFSRIAFHDDEGYMMLIVEHFLAGHTLYDEVSTLYGPVYFFYKWLVHAVVGQPLTHDVVRLTAITTWLVTALVSAIVVLRQTTSVALAALVQLLTTVHLSVIVSEPGHPQELAGLLVVIVVAVSVCWPDRSLTRLLVVWGLLVAALAMIKINLGVLVGLAAVMAVLSLVPATAASITLSMASLLALVALPALLMRPMLHLTHVQNFAATQTLSVIALSIVALTSSRGQLRLSDLVVFAASCIAGVTLIGLATMATGTTIAALVDCLITTPARLPALYHSMADDFFPLPRTAAYAVALAVTFRLTSRWRAQPHVLACAKLVFGIIVFSVVWHGDRRALLSDLTPFVWLALARAPAQPDGARGLARLLCCWGAVLQPLQAYPVAGSQVYFGTVLHIIVGAVCVGDGVAWLGSLPSRIIHGAVRLAAAALLVFVGGASGREVRAAQQRYSLQVPLDLPGASRLRSFPFHVEELHDLTRTLREHSDTFLCMPGFNSLYFWAGMKPPTLDVLGHEMRLYSEERWAAMISALLRHERPMIVQFRGLAANDPALEARLKQWFKPLMRISKYKLLVRR